MSVLKKEKQGNAEDKLRLFLLFLLNKENISNDDLNDLENALPPSLFSSAIPFIKKFLFIFISYFFNFILFICLFIIYLKIKFIKLIK